MLVLAHCEVVKDFILVQTYHQSQNRWGIERVTYQNDENGFCVIRVKARSHRDLVTVVGHAATIAAGEWITASGDWVNDRTHGQQFRARFLKTSEPTTVEGIKKYLGRVRGQAGVPCLNEFYRIRDDLWPERTAGSRFLLGNLPAGIVHFALVEAHGWIVAERARLSISARTLPLAAALVHL